MRTREGAASLRQVLVQAAITAQGRDLDPFDALQRSGARVVAEYEMSRASAAQQRHIGRAPGMDQGALAFDDDELGIPCSYQFPLHRAAREVHPNGIQWHSAAHDRNSDLA